VYFLSLICHGSMSKAGLSSTTHLLEVIRVILKALNLMVVYRRKQYWILVLLVMWVTKPSYIWLVSVVPWLCGSQNHVKSSLGFCRLHLVTDCINQKGLDSLVLQSTFMRLDFFHLTVCK
jgi:hypothetical protein